MPNLAAPGDTWGVSGPDFLLIYGAALAVFLVLAVVLRLSATRAGEARQAGLPVPAEVAFLVGGRSQAVYSSVAALRAVGAVGTDKGRLKTTGPLPAGATALDAAVHDVVGRGVRVNALGDDVRVQAALTDVETRVTSSGWLLDGDARARARLGGILLVGLTAFGVARTVSGITNDRPVIFVVLLTILTAILSVVFLVVPRASRSGKLALATLRTRNAHLAPRQAPAWSTYGMTGAAMGVALYGTAALWAADPSFAADAGLRRTSTDSAGSDSGSYGGDSGGGDGGGGGGCGGGGCGG